MHPVGHPIVRLDTVDSTNTRVLEHETELDTPGLVVLAQHQTGGRGTMGRAWASLPGRQLQFSVVLHPALPPEDLPAVSLVSGLAVAGAIRDGLGLAARLKWPNDVRVNGRKVCGILMESKPRMDGTSRLVVGIGINCNGAPDDFPPELRGRLTTLAAEAGAEVETEALLAAVLRNLEDGCTQLEGSGKAGVLADWRRLALLGPEWRVRLAPQQGRAEGYAEDVTPEGYLIVRLDDGRRVTQVSGQLEWLA